MAILGRGFPIPPKILPTAPQPQTTVTLDATAGYAGASGALVNGNAGNCIIVAAKTNGGTNTITNVTYGAATLSLIGFIPSNNGTSGGVAMYGKLGSLPTGSNTVTVTGGPPIWAGATTYGGVSSIGTAVTAFGNSSSGIIAVANTTASSLIVAATSYGGNNGGGTFTAGPSSTIRWQEDINNTDAAGNGMFEDQASLGTGKTTLLSWTNSAGADWWGMVAVELLPVTSGVPVNVTGVTATVTVAAVNGTVTEAIPGTVSTVAAAAVAGTVTESIPGVAAAVTVTANPGGAGSTGVTGPTGTVTVSAVAGTVTISPAGVASAVTVTPIAGTVVETITGTTATDTVAAQAGTVKVNPQGTVSNVNAAANNGTAVVNIPGTAATVTATAIAGTVNVTTPGVASNVNVVANP